MSAKPRVICQFNRLNPAKFHTPPAAHQRPDPSVNVTSNSASNPKIVRRSQRRRWTNLGQTRRNLPHMSSRSQKPPIACSTKMSHSCGWPVIRLTTPVMKAITVASAMLQSVRRGDIRDDPSQDDVRFYYQKSRQTLIMSIPYLSVKDNAIRIR